MATPTLVVVSGPFASGKTTLAHALAQAIPCPAICRDEIKEGMVHAHGAAFQPGPGDPLTQRTLPLFFDVLRVLLTAGVTVVAEAAFQDPLWRSGLEPLSDLARLRLVHCTVDEAVARERLAWRDQNQRAAHGDSKFLQALESGEKSYATYNRVSIPAPSIIVDTADGYAPSLAEIVHFVNRP